MKIFNSLCGAGVSFLILTTLYFPLVVSEVNRENLLFVPSKEFKENANMKSWSLFEEASQNRETFWGKQAECLVWFSAWDRVLEWNPPDAKWFIGGKLNACYNCLDRHMETLVRKKIALIWEGERGEERTITYEELYREVNQFSNVLKGLGVQKGDKVAIYLP